MFSRLLLRSLFFPHMSFMSVFRVSIRRRKKNTVNFNKLSWLWNGIFLEIKLLLHLLHMSVTSSSSHRMASKRECCTNWAADFYHAVIKNSFHTKIATLTSNLKSLMSKNPFAKMSLQTPWPLILNNFLWFLLFVCFKCLIYIFFWE